MAIKRYAPFILLNILISAAVVLGILYLWEQNEVEEEQIATATSVAATAPVETAAAVATASAPPPPTATAERVTHIVQGGETLGTIAQQYDHRRVRLPCPLVFREELDLLRGNF